MKLKFINLLLVSVFLVGAVQVFTSCKDNEADVLVDLKADTVTLKQKLEDDEKQLAEVKAALQKEIADRTTAVEGLAQKIVNLQNEFNNKLNDYATKAELEAAKKALNEKIDALTLEIKANLEAIATLQGDVEKINAALTLINSRLDGIDTSISGLAADIDKIKEQVLAGVNEIVVINTELGEIKVDITGIKDQIADLFNKYQELSLNLSGLEARLTTVETTLQSVKDDLLALTGRVSVLEGRVDKIDGDISDILNAINNMQGSIGDMQGKISTLTIFMNTWEPILPEIQKNASEALALANQNAYDIAALQAVVALLQEQVKLGNEQCEAVVEMLQSEIESLAAQLENCVTLEELEFVVSELQAQAEHYYNSAITYTIYMCAGLRSYMNDEFAAINGNLNNINSDISNINSDINSINISVGEILSELTRIENAIAAGDQAVLNEVNSKITELDNQFSEKIANAIALINDLQGEVNDLKDLGNTLSSALANVKTDILNLNSRLESVESALAPLSGRIEEVAGRINNIILQQTDNWVFGTLNLPVGINSMMLLAYAGENTFPMPAPFPAVVDDFNSFNGTSQGIGNLTYEELSALGVAQEQIDDAILMNRDEDTNMGVLGTIYMTVNPANASLDGKSWSVVNSQNKALPIQLNPVASNKELNFGYTRADNGFYETQALIPVTDEAISKVRFTLSSSLKSELKDILSAPREALSKPQFTIAALGSAIYNQFNGFLPALGVSANWTESDGSNMQVTSQYGLAAATINPLALNFLVGKSMPNIPNLPDLSNLPDKFNAFLDNVRNKIVVEIPKDFTVPYSGGTFIVKPTIEFDLSVPNQTITVSKTVDVHVNIYESGHEDDPAYLVGVGTVVVPIDVDVELNDFIATLNSSVNTAVNNALNQAFGQDWVDAVNDDINNMINDMCGEIASQVNKLLVDMQQTIDTAIDNVFDEIQSSVTGKIETLVSKYEGITNRVESLIGRINKFLSEPNFYLQPVLLYKNGTKVGILSTTKAYPTLFKANVGNPAIILHPTTYTLETVVPLYKKYVAVTHVWDNTTGVENNAVRDAANSQGNLNKVVPASYHSMGLVLKSGYTYEIIYQGLDYSANVAGRKYYVTVK